MTAVADATTIIETAIKRTLVGSQLRNIGLRYKQVDPWGKGVFVDPENPTDEELAQCYIDNLVEWSKAIVRTAAEGEERENQEATTIDAAGDTAVADLE